MKYINHCRKFILQIDIGGKLGKPLMTTFSIYNLSRNNDFDSSKAKNELGYTTRPYVETIKDEIKWLKDNNLINA